MEETMPLLTLRERDRRWAVLRDMMRANELDCLLVGGHRGREHFESFVTDDYIEGVVVFPLNGEPVTLTWTDMRVSRAQESFSRGVEPWVRDYRMGATGAGTAAVLREKGYARGRIGVVGLRSVGPGEPEGCVPATFWLNLTAELSDATVADVSWAFAELMLVKSEEELAQVRYAARVGESACRAMLETTRPGIGEEAIYAEIMREIFRHACDARYPTLCLQSGPQNIGWGPPRWISRAERPRRVQRGDMVQAEIFPCCGCQEAQLQMSIALDPVDEANRQCEEVARQSYEAGVKAIRPGVSFWQVVQIMEEPSRAAGCWAKTPLIHSINPLGWSGRVGVNREQLDGTTEGRILASMKEHDLRRGSELILRPGMTFALEPNACLGTHRVNIGGSVIVTDTGCEQLNVLPTRVHHIG